MPGWRRRRGGGGATPSARISDHWSSIESLLRVLPPPLGHAVVFVAGKAAMVWAAQRGRRRGDEVCAWHGLGVGPSAPAMWAAPTGYYNGRNKSTFTPLKEAATAGKGARLAAPAAIREEEARTRMV
uniref:Uncharacterized protein n=1 Tax=Oryza barthii TaxID=65489 RepID=A0A0D3F117_9ORYZ